MSIEYCEYCDQHIDTDFNLEHFIFNKAYDKIVGCVINEQGG